MPIYNQCQFIGNLGQDPEMNYTPTGTAVTNLSIAVDRREKKEDEWVSETTWIRLTAFGKTAESMHQHLGVGDKIVVQAEYQKRQYQDDEGNDRYSHDFIIREWRIASRSMRSQEEDEATDEVETEEDDDYMPF